MFLGVVPGMARLVSREVEQLPGVQVTDVGYDGRAELVLVDVDRGARDNLWSLRTIEDIFVEIGRTTRSSGDKPHWIAGRIWRPERVERALSIWSADVRPLASGMTFRVIARVLQEKSFLRTELRNSLSQAISMDKSRWRFGDPAQLEIWISEYRPGKLVAGLRLSDAAMRQHDGRVVERQGALRASVAAMMVNLAGEPGQALLDLCCGSGTILSEALAAGWSSVAGCDNDDSAVEASKQNVPRATIAHGDARKLELPTASMDAVVSNLPFGRQYEVDGAMNVWLADVLGEIARVTRPGGRVVLLAPRIPRDSIPGELAVRRREQVRLLGTKTVLWVFERA